MMKLMVRIDREGYVPITMYLEGTARAPIEAFASMLAEGLELMADSNRPQRVGRRFRRRKEYRMEHLYPTSRRKPVEAALGE